MLNPAEEFRPHGLQCRRMASKRATWKAKPPGVGSPTDGSAALNCRRRRALQAQGSQIPTREADLSGRFLVRGRQLRRLLRGRFGLRQEGQGILAKLGSVALAPLGHVNDA
jgi:hypothetical protein